MVRNRVYYIIKPLLPTGLRFALRRWLARWTRQGVHKTWPILPGAEKPPLNWPGWPNGKKFALVLTHDVEGSSGVENIQRLIELEKALGFRSSFNLIPEGEYPVPVGLRESITRNGFEVGVHDLKHDGKLFLNRQDFSRKAQRINRYLTEWGAVGFRSGFMLHNLDWIQDLNLSYDASTFDTDPFEPQPQGQHTIFPFWVPRRGESPDAKGYVELPYTLPQDSTLFLVLGEKHPDIWIQKLDWIAEHGGMVLVNVHPDYLRFSDQVASRRHYSVEVYSRFLEYASSRYRGAFWQALPREVASFVRQEKVSR